MKKINKHSIINIENTDVFDNTFSIDYLLPLKSPSDEREVASVKIIYMKDLLEEYKNEEVLEKVKEKPAMWSEVYSPSHELEIFTKLFEQAIET